MKHVILAGASRCGKTTISLKLKNLGLVHYKMDSIKRGIDKNFWDGYKDDWVSVSPHMAKLINVMLSDYQTDIVKDKEYYLIDTCHLYPSDIVKYNLKDTIIVFVGYSEVDPYKKLKQIRKYDKNVWSNHVSDKEMIYGINLGIEYSKIVKEECRKNNIKYFDISKNFNKVLNEIYEYIINELGSD